MNSRYRVVLEKSFKGYRKQIEQSGEGFCREPDVPQTYLPEAGLFML
jgi:hypothetical protein